MDRIKSKSIVKTDKVYLRQLELQKLLKPFIPEARLNAIIFEIEQLYKVEE